MEGFDLLIDHFDFDQGLTGLLSREARNVRPPLLDMASAAVQRAAKTFPCAWRRAGRVSICRAWLGGAWSEARGIPPFARMPLHCARRLLWVATHTLHCLYAVRKIAPSTT